MLDTPFVKIISGVRRCGKSTILKMVVEKLRERGVADDHILTYSFDSLQDEDMTAKMLYVEVKGRLPSKGKTYLFFDEIQEVKDWEKAVTVITATKFRSNIGKYFNLVGEQDVYITKHGKSIAKLSSTKQDKVEIAKSLFGIIPNDGTALEQTIEERMARYNNELN